MERGLKPATYLLLGAALLMALVLSVCLGSVSVPASDVLAAVYRLILGQPVSQTGLTPIVAFVRLPRVLCVLLTGASLSIAGAAMQGLLQNPLADGTTLGVSAGASLGAVLAIAFGFAIPGLPLAGTMGTATVFALFSLVLILFLAERLDRSLSTGTIILIGVIFSMFANAIISLVVTFAGERVRSIMFWTMGSLAGSSYQNALVLLCALLVCGAVILRNAAELNAFAIGESHARHIGVDTTRVRRTLLVAVSVLIGVTVSLGGTIAFVGLVIPHMTRLLTGPNHRRLLPATLFFGPIFLLMCDLLGRVVLRPVELPIGVVTSFVGSIAFVYLFARARRAG